MTLKNSQNYTSRNSPTLNDTFEKSSISPERLKEIVNSLVAIGVSEKYAPSFAEYMAKFKISVNDLTPENVDDMIEYTQNRKARSEIIKVASTEKYKKAA